MTNMTGYQTSTYLSVALNASLAENFWKLEETHLEQFHHLFNFLQEHGDSGYLQWLEQWRDQVDAYMDGGKSCQQVLKDHPEQIAFFRYAEWRQLQDGALVNTLLSRYGYAETCSQRGAYVQSVEFLEVLLRELSELSIYPPTVRDAYAEQEMLRGLGQQNS